jgi:hypothetical protein
VLASYRDNSYRAPGPLKVNADIATQVLKGFLQIKQRRATSQLITVYRDVTHTLPGGRNNVSAISDNDYQAAAQKYDVPIAAIKAVAKVELGGRKGFDEKGRPKILFESHLFRKFSQQLYDHTHPHLSMPYSKAVRKYYKWDQYSRLYEAMVLDPEAALKSASWGLFQVMGFNHNGWPDATSFAKAMFVSEINHLTAFFAFCDSNGLMRHLKAQNWAAFAKAYNGPDYAVNQYDTKLADAYKAAGGK